MESHPSGRNIKILSFPEILQLRHRVLIQVNNTRSRDGDEIRERCPSPEECSTCTASFFPLGTSVYFFFFSPTTLIFKLLFLFISLFILLEQSPRAAVGGRGGEHGEETRGGSQILQTGRGGGGKREQCTCRLNLKLNRNITRP